MLWTRHGAEPRSWKRDKVAIMALQKYIRLDEELCSYVREHRSDLDDPVWRDLREETTRLGAVSEMMIPEEESALLSSVS